MQADLYVRSNTPSLGSIEQGCIDPDAAISPCANRMGKHAYQAHFKIYLDSFEKILPFKGKT